MCCCQVGLLDPHSGEVEREIVENFTRVSGGQTTSDRRRLAWAPNDNTHISVHTSSSMTFRLHSVSLAIATIEIFREDDDIDELPLVKP